MITAEPDITLTQLQEGDRFFILACDGVWDCLSNQQAVCFQYLL
jgi:serine/threonine protein phosphatase PrpC